jgi:hypothetical protein
MSKNERNERIIAALRIHGTLAGAAYDTGVHQSTVKRLTKNDERASDALAEGITTRIQERLHKHAERDAQAAAQLQEAAAKADVLRSKLSRESVDLDYVAIRELKKELSALHDIELLRMRAARLAARTLRQATARAEAIYGISPAGEPGEEEELPSSSKEESDGS